MPVRIPKRQSAGITGSFPSLKLGRMVAFESTLERDYLYLLDFEPSVTTFEEQPLTITYEHDGKVRRYTPDFLIREADREVLVECKPAAKLEHNDNPLKFAAARIYCEERGWSFRVVTDMELRRGYLLENIKRLTYYARATVPTDLAFAVTHLCHESEGLTIIEIVDQLPQFGPEQVTVAVWHLVYHHHLRLSPNRPLSDPTTRVLVTRSTT